MKQRAGLALYAVVRAIVVGFCKTFWRLSVEGREHVPASGSFVLAPVHRSNIDFAVVAAVTRRRMRYMGKDTLWKMRWFGAFISALGAFPVHRGAADREALRIVHETFADGEVVSIFITGHRQRELTGAKDGAGMLAVVEGVTVIPAAIRGSGGWRPGRRVRVSFGPPRTYARDGRRGRDAYRAAAQDLVEEIGRLYGD